MFAKFLGDESDVSPNGYSLNNDLHTTEINPVATTPTCKVPTVPEPLTVIELTVLKVLTVVTDPALPIVMSSVCVFPKTSVPVIVAVSAESLPPESKVITEAASKPPSEVIPGTF